LALPPAQLNPINSRGELILLFQFIGNPLASISRKLFTLGQPRRHTWQSRVFYAAAYLACSIISVLVKTTHNNKFQQIGSDLQSGNLFQAQSDFALFNNIDPGDSKALRPHLPPVHGTPTRCSPPSTNWDKLCNPAICPPAQSDFATVQQDVQQIAQQQSAGGAHHHHHHYSSDSDSQTSSQQTAISTLFNELGTSLQTGNLTAAQQACSTLQQDFQQFALGGSSSTSSSSTSAGASGLSVSA
jgi:hypothetical protein